MSLVRSNRPNWLRPFGALFVLSAIFVSQVILPVSAVITSKSSADINWIRLDENFPPTLNEQKEIIPFFYARGLLDANMSLTNEFIDEIENSSITDFHITFDIWRNAKRCAKYFSFTPDSITDLHDGVWTTFERQYPNNATFRDFNIWLAALTKCEDSLVALRNLKLYYNRYQIDGKDDYIKESGHFKTIKTPTDPEVKKEDLKNWQTYLFNCKTDSCLIEVPKTVFDTTEAHLSFWHSTAAVEVTVVDYPTVKATGDVNSKIRELVLKKVDFSTIKTSSVTIKIVTKDDTPVAVKSETVQLDLSHVKSYVEIDMFPAESSKFLEMPEFKALAELPVASSVYLDQPVEIRASDNPCYKFSYFIDQKIHDQFSISLVRQNGYKVSRNRYKLFDFVPTKIGIVEDEIHFCLREFIRDRTVLDGRKVQFLLETKLSTAIPKITSITLVSLVRESPDKSMEDVTYKFLTDRATLKSTARWTNRIPGSLNTVEEKNNEFTTTNVQQKFQLHSHWIKRSTKLSELPLRLKLSVPGLTQVEAQVIFTSVKFRLQICDDIMDCISLKLIAKVQVYEKAEILFDYIFDQHPNEKSTLLKLVLHVELPIVGRDTPVKISLVNFGDPCHSMVRDNFEHKCPANYECKADPKDEVFNLIEANDLVKSCVVFDYCDADASTKCQVTTEGCRNNAKNDGFECVCKADPLHIWDMMLGVCVAVQERFISPAPTASNFKHISTWKFPLDKINQHIYDICYRFKPTVKAAENLKVTINLRLENIADGKKTVKLLEALSFELNEKSSELIDLCLSQLVDHVPETWSLVAEIDATRALVKKDSLFYGKVKSKDQEFNLPESKVTGFKIATQMPKGFMKVEQDGTKQVISFAKVKADLPSVIDVVIFSDWITNEKSLTLAQIDKNIITIDDKVAPNTISICRPRTELGSDCKLFTGSNLGEILTTLGSDKFQLMLHVPQLSNAANVKIEEKKISSEVSIWDACVINDVKCANVNTQECLAGADAHKFKCVAKGSKECPQGLSGIFCQIDNMASCVASENEKKYCTSHGYGCYALEDGSFECACPSGFVFDQKDNRCERSVLQAVEKICAPGHCFVDKILNEPFHFLPKHFPIIRNADQTGRELFYAIKSDSKLTITVNDADKYWAKVPENDVCVRFKYFVAPQARLSLRFNGQIDLWRIDGIESSASSIPNAFGNDQTGIELSKEVNVCIKALLPLDKLKNLTNFQLSFVSQTDNLNEAVAVELLKVDGHYLYQTNNLYIPAKALRYLSNENKDLKEPPTGVDRLSYQWTANFPDYRWTELDYSSIQLLRQETGTVESAYLESAWIERLVQTSSPVNLNFKVEVDLRNQLRNDFIGTVYLIDSDRKRLTSFEAKFTQKDILDPKPEDIKPNQITKSQTFSFPINANIDFGKMFKVQFHIRYQDNKKPIAFTLPEGEHVGFLLKISEINFGDPCIDRAAPQKCWGIVDGVHKVDLMARCIRNELSNGGMSYACNCAHESLSGINCQKIDFCKFKHTISMMDPRNILQYIYSETKTGNEFCAQDGKIATCTRGRFENHQFVCECNNKTHFFDWLNRKCEPIDQCILNPCNFETEMCKQKNVNGVLVSDCYCKPGYARNSTNGPCVAITNEDEQCDLKVECNHDPNDTHMKCIAGPYDLKMWVCPKGFRRDDTSPSGLSCKSAYCDFPGLHKCSHKCMNIETAPYYQCSCEDHYDRDVATEKCTLKANAPVTCQECKDAKYKVCQNGKCSCIDNFVESGADCVPSANYQLKGCPNGQTKIDPIDGSLACDCAKNKTSGYFIDDATMQKTCRLSKTVCDSGEKGQSLCASRDAACLIDPFNLEEHSCKCNLGKLFPDGRRMKKATELRSNQEVMCVDVCDLPYKSNQCASIGAKCNPAKLLNSLMDIASPTIINIRSIPTEKYCECVTGTFYDTSIGQCVQELESLSLNLTFRWTHVLQGNLDEILNRFVNFVGFGTNREINLPEEFVSLENSFSFADPYGFAHSLIRIKRTNLEADAKTIKEWKQLTRKILLLTKVEDLLYSFNLIDHHSKDDRTEVKEIGRDVKIVSIHEQILDGNPNYVLKLAVKISEEIRESLQAMNTVGSSSGLRYNMSNFQIIMDSCHVFKNKENCVIPYMSVVLGSSSLMPVLNKPCTNADTCHGMSNCIPKTGSQFSCECDLKHFDVEDANSFPAKSNGSLVVLKNDRCKPKL